MAVAAQRAWELYKGKALIVLRFIGATPDSSSIRTLLYSIITQVRRLFQDEKTVPTNMKNLVDEFHTVLHLASGEQPMVLILDALDQFTSAFNGRQLFWLPSKLPRHVKIILSTLPDDEHECFPRLKMILQNDDQFIAMPRLTSEEVHGILSTWLEKGTRALKPEQRQLITDTFAQSPLPLYLKLCYDEACRWPSYLSPSESNLQTTIQKAIQALFTRLENCHSKLLVSRMLGYITLSRKGLSEMELEDILSCDDDVLNDVYQAAPPPIRRVPPLLLIRIMSHLRQCLVSRCVEEVVVTYWYHKQFVEVARSMYCSDSSTNKLIHTNIADYFRGVWAEKTKPYKTTKTGKQQTALRYVAKQPFKYETRFNLRKLMELPVHLIHSEQLTVLKDELLCNLRWLTAKMEATSLRHVLDDFMMALQYVPEDEDLKTVYDVLQLSQEALNQDPHQLPGQLVGRIPHGNDKLRAQCCRPPYPALIPSQVVLTEPGGQLVHSRCEHSNEVNALDLSKDGHLAVTCSDDHTVKLWDVHSGKLSKSIDNVGDSPSFLRFCCDDTCVVVVDSQHIYLITLETSEVTIIDEKTIDISGANVHKFLVFSGGSELVVPFKKGLTFLSLPSGINDFIIKDQFLKPRDSFGSYSDILDGHKDFVAITGAASVGSTLHHEVHIADVRERKFLHSVTLFQKPQNEVEDEYTVDALAMTHDEKLVIAAEMLENHLHFISIETGEVVRKIEGNNKDSSDLFHITPDDKFLYFCNIDHMCVWNIDTGVRSYTLHHGTRATDIQTRDQKTYISISVDTVCFWDVTRTDVHMKVQNDLPYETTMMMVMPHTDRYIVLKKEPKHDMDLPSLLCVYDILQEEYSRKIKWPKSSSNKAKLHITDDDRVVTVHERRVVIVNLKDNSHKVCPGTLSKRNENVYPIKMKPWLVTLTRGRLKLKVYNWLTATVEFILEAGQEAKIEHFTASPGGNVVAALCESWPIYIFDLTTRSLLHKLSMNSDIYCYISMVLADDGSFIVQHVSRKDEKENISQPLDYATVTDLTTGKLMHHLLDWDAYRVVEADHSDEDLSVITQLALRHLVITAHYDHTLRVWDTHTGIKLHSLQFDAADELRSMYITPDGSRLVTGHRTCVYIWDTSSWYMIASFRMDQETSFRHHASIRDGSVMVLSNECGNKLAQLRLAGEGISAKRDQRRLKEIYKPNLKLDSKPIIFDISESDACDPDSEMDELTSDEDSEDEYLNDSKSFTLHSDLRALSHGKFLDDFDLGGTNDLDLDPDSDLDDSTYDTRTRFTWICDSAGANTSAKYSDP